METGTRKGRARLRMGVAIENSGEENRYMTDPFYPSRQQKQLLTLNTELWAPVEGLLISWSVAHLIAQISSGGFRSKQPALHLCDQDD